MCTCDHDALVWWVAVVVNGVACAAGGALTQKALSRSNAGSVQFTLEVGANGDVEGW